MMRRVLTLLYMLILMCGAGPALAAHVQEIKAENGLKAWLIEDHTLPVFTLRIAFENSGAAYDPAGKEGLATFVSSMLDEGAGNMDSLAFNQALEGSAIRFGSEAGEDSFVVSLQSLSEYHAKTLELLTLALSSPRFDKDAVERIRSGSISELKELTADPSYISSLAWKQAAFKGHPYGRPRKGTLQTLAGITRQDLQDYAQWHFNCSPKVIAAVGDITPGQLKDWLAKLPQPVCAVTGPFADVPDVAVAVGGASPVLVKTAVPQTVITASLPAVKRDDKRFYVLELLNHVLGGNSLTARLGREIRDKRGLAYYAESELASLDHAGYFAFSFASRTEKVNEALSVFSGVLDALGSKGITPEELADAKSYLTGSFALQIDTQPALADYLLGMQHYNLGMDFLEKRNGLITSVTLADVNEAAKQFLSQHPLIVMAGQQVEK